MNIDFNLVATAPKNTGHMVEYLRISLREVLKKASDSGLSSIAMPLLVPKVPGKQRKEIAARQIELTKEYASASEDSSLSVINIVTANSDDCNVIKDAIMS